MRPPLYARRPARNHPYGPDKPRGDGGGKGGGGKKKGGGDGGPGFLIDPLNRRRFRREMRAAERLEYGPTLRAMRSAYQASAFRENQQLPAWFQNYQNQLASLRGESQGAYDHALAQIQGYGAQIAGQDLAQRQAVQAQLAQDAANR